MNISLNKLKIATKIGGGFGILIVMLLIISVVGWRGLTGIYDGFIEYRGLARDTNLTSRLQANMLMVRMNVKGFMNTQSEKDLEQYKEYYEKMSAFLSEAKREIQNPKRAALIREYAKNVEEYDRAFFEVVDLYHERDRLLNEVLAVVGPKSEENLTSIMASAKDDGDAEAAYEAGIALRHILLGRLYAQRFLDTNSVEHYERVNNELEEANQSLNVLGRVLENPERARLNKEVIEFTAQYLEAFDQQADAINIRNEIIKNTLEALGPVMAKAVEDVELSVKSEQDALGPVVQAHAATAKNVMLVVSLVALAIAVLAGVLISAAIVKPVKMVSGFVDRLAKGDFTARIDTDSQDEIGIMIRSLNGMAEELREGFVFIKEGVSNMASSTTELSAISTQLAGNAEQSSNVSNNVASSTEQTSHNMTTVASSVEQMSVNLQSVATASEEMTATIEEIAKNTDRGRTVTQTAVTRVNATSEQVNQLGQAADLIGNITDTIKGISEQTNLLALNATIEAASAGEAGKGFAVVANEIKDLSRQTAQATEQISQSINNIQSTTKVSIDNIAGIVDVIGEIDEITAMIASAVEEQSNTTSEIAANVSQTADGVKEVARNVNQVNEVTTEVAKDVHQVNQAAVEIASASNQLRASSGELSEFAEKLDAMASHYQV